MTRFALSDLSPSQQQQAREQLGLAAMQPGGCAALTTVGSTDIAPEVPRGALQSKRKYRNQPVEIDGQRFDSKLESRYWTELKLRRATGQVAWWIRQVRFDLPGRVVYRADYLVVLPDGGIEIVDCKGFLTGASWNKIKQVQELYGIEVILWSDRPKAGM